MAGALVPVVAPARRAACAAILACNLAEALAETTGRAVLLVDRPALGSAPWPAARASPLPSLAEVIAEPALLARHDAPGPGVRAVSGVVDPACCSPGAVGAALRLLADRYAYVVAVLIGDEPGLLVDAAGAAGPARVIAIPGPGADPRPVRLAERLTAGRPTRVRVLAPDGPAWPTTGALADLGAIYGGHPVRVASGWEHAAAGDPVFVRRGHTSPAAEALRWLARDVAGLKVGIALGAGSAKGFAHIGVLEALQEAGVPIDAIAGTSVGAVVGSMWALGFAPDAIERRLGETRHHAVRPALPWRSVLRGDGIAGHIRRTAAGGRFEDTITPFAVVTVDLQSGREIVFRSGPLWEPVLASSSIPGVYPPVRIGDRWLVDGGLLDPVPAAAAAALGADVILGVKLSGAGVAAPWPRAPGIVETVLRASELMHGRLAEIAAARSTLVIEPAWPAGRRIGLGAFGDGAEHRRRGALAVSLALPQLRALLPWLR